MNTKMNYFSELNFSPMPLICSLSAFNFFLGSMIMIELYESIFFVTSALILAVCSFFWWSDFSMEMKGTGMILMTLQECLKFSMILFILSEVFFFSSFFWAYFHYFLCSEFSQGLKWPSLGILTLEKLGAPMLNTLILIFSALILTMSHYLISKFDFIKSFFLTFMTMILGLIFLLSQVGEYFSSFFKINDGDFGSIFFVLTGFHGIHVIIGSLFLFIISVSTLKLKTSQFSIYNFELSAWYWHFVDVVWLFLFFVLYYLPS